MKNVFYFKYINAIGGIESWLYYISELYGDKYDIHIYYKDGDPLQIARLKKKAIVHKFYGQQIYCDKAIFCFNTDIINNVHANKYAMFIHGDYEKQKCLPDIPPQITEFYAVSQVAKDSFKRLTGIECKVIYNPLYLPTPQRELKIVAATRLTSEKGKDRYETLAKKLHKYGQLYRIDIFTDDNEALQAEGIYYHKPVLDISRYIKEADYLAQLSSSERILL